MANTTITPGTGSVSLTGNSAALIVDGSGRTAINDFRGSSKSEVINGSIHIEVLDGPPRGRENEPSVIGVLASVVSLEGMSGPTISRGRDAQGEDGVLTFPDGRRLLVQIVSVPVDPTYWKSVSDGRAAIQLSFEEAAVWLHDAMEKKARPLAPADKAEIVLALDARHCAQIAYGEVIESLEQRFGDPRKYGFAQIWLVGPVPNRSCRLA